MIPPFNEDGYLPPGVHPATLDEVEARFGRETEIRRVQMESLRWLVELARKAGVVRIVVNGSFVTDKPEPNDVDCAVLTQSGFPRDSDAENMILAGLPFITCELLPERAFRFLIERTFASDRAMKPKGMIEVVP